MSRVRFATAKDLFETFPELFKTIKAAPSEEAPINFLKGLSAQGRLEDAYTFCAYLLPRREAVWWACACVRKLTPTLDKNKAAGLNAAEDWVQQPEDDRRLAALDIATKGDPDDPQTYLAYAAGRSGGILFHHPETPIAMQANFTPQAARTAIQLAAHYADAAQRPTILRDCIEDGVNLATNGL